MDATIIFKITNLLALLSWGVLLILAHSNLAINMLRYGVAIIFALVYASLIFTSSGDLSLDSFSSLEKIRALFSQDKALLAGWIHYLCFDLLIGIWIVENGKTNNLPRWLYSIPLPFTFMLGPFGYLLYTTFRFLHTKFSKI